jgi:Mg-chelatase subunit ChlD
VKPGLSEIVFVLDRSGSMASLVRDVVGSFDQFVSEQKAQPGDARFTLVQFSDHAERTVERQPIREVGSLWGRYSPAGSTALLDALGETIERLGRDLHETPEAERPEHVIVVVLTDGEENASRRFDRTRVREMVEHQQSVYRWNFLFLGANQDAFAEAGKLGVHTAMTFDADAGGIRDAYAATSHAVSTFRAGADGGEVLRRRSGSTPVN